MDGPSQSSHQGGHVFVALMQSMCRWSNEINGMSRLVDPHVAATGRHVRCLRDQTEIARSCFVAKISENMQRPGRGDGQSFKKIKSSCLVKKQELYAMKFTSIAEFRDESIEVLIFPHHITFAKIAQSLGSRKELLIGT
ncbi:hypothetical protein YC2023_082781 [Brassica napus]